MKTLARTDIGPGSSGLADLVTTLRAGGLVCVPVRGAYRLVVDALAEPAVNRLMQLKRRTSNRPALVLVPDLASAAAVVDGTRWPITQKLARAFWPGSLTLVLPPSDALPPKVRKVLTRATGKLGVRASSDPIAAALVRAFGGPLLASSANLERKTGAGSAAAIRSRFGSQIDVWVDGGDPAAEPASTLIEVDAGGWTMLREGAIDRAALERVAGAGAT